MFSNLLKDKIFQMRCNLFDDILMEIIKSFNYQWILINQTLRNSFHFNSVKHS